VVDKADGESPIPDAREWRTEHRYRAVREVLDGAAVTEVARQYGTSRQALHG
jgi:transposase-like protein